MVDAVAAPPRARPRVRPRLAVVGAAVGVAAALLVAFRAYSGCSPDLAAKAYAQTTPGQDVLYVRTRFHVEGLPNVQVQMTEEWLRGDQLHGVSRTVAGGQTLRGELVIGPDGVLRIKHSN
jgi:hypothetical protein